MPRKPTPASKPLYYIVDSRDCYEDQGEAVRAAQAKPGHEDGYIWVFCFETPPTALSGLLESLPEGKDDV